MRGLFKRSTHASPVDCVEACEEGWDRKEIARREALTRTSRTLVFVRWTIVLAILILTLFILVSNSRNSGGFEEEYNFVWKAVIALLLPDAPDLAVERCTNPNKIAPGGAVDVVYTWVNGSDPSFLALRRMWEVKEGILDEDYEHGDHRYRDKDELLFSLRSVALFTPWIRNVYILSNSLHPPSWLNLSLPNVFFVPVDTIFPDKNHLPTFSSSAMQVHLHRIPGLSRWFILLDDDVLFLHDVCLEDFYSPERGWKLYEVATIRALAYPLIERYPERLRPTSFELDKRFRSGFRNKIAHIPFMMDRDIYHNMTTVLHSLCERTSATRFRFSTSPILAHSFGYYHFLAGEGHAHEHVYSSVRRVFFELNDRNKYNVDITLEEAIQSRPTIQPAKFLCINDNALKLDEDAALSLRRFFCYRFPKRSIFERPDTHACDGIL